MFKKIFCNKRNLVFLFFYIVLIMHNMKAQYEAVLFVTTYHRTLEKDLMTSLCS